MTDKEAKFNLERLYPVLSETQKMAVDVAVKALSRSNGRWVRKRLDKSHYSYYCNRCGHESRFYKSNYCHYCGAKMQKEEV